MYVFQAVRFVFGIFEAFRISHCCLANRVNHVLRVPTNNGTTEA